MQLGPNPTFDLMGLANNGNCNGPMTFRKRNERIDWRKIASIDLERISHELDFDTLQDNIANVAFCNIECELDSRCCDPNYTKLFRLAQLIIEYLLHSQDYLSHTVVALEEKCRFLTAQHDCEKKNKCATEELIKSLKDDVKKYKKLQKNSNVLRAAAECHACPFCPKVFLTSDYLQMHMKRRHLDTCHPDTQNEVATLVEKLEKEVSELRAHLHATQCQLQNEHKTKPNDDMQVWKVHELESQKKEIESIRDLFMKEMREINDRTTFAEYCVNNLQKELHDVCNSPPSSPPCPAPPPPCPLLPREENCEMLKGQKKEFCKLRKGLTQHVENVVCHQLKTHEDVLQKRIKCLAKEQTQELEKLNCLVQEKFAKPDNTTQTETMLHNLCERTKEQERKLKKQERKIEELICTQTLATPVRAEPKPEPKACPKTRRDSDVNSVESFQSPCRSKHVEALKNNQSLVEGLREEFSSMLQDKLDHMGIASKRKNTSPVYGKHVTIHPRSKSWSGIHEADVEEEEDDDDESDESEVVESVKSRKRSLPKSPSMPIPSVSNSKESDGEWKRKISKPSRLLSTKASFSKLVTSVKKKLKPGKFWQMHSTPVKDKEKKQNEPPQLELKESTSSAAILEYETEHDESDDESESEDEIENEESKDKLKMPQRSNLKNIDESEEKKLNSSSEWESSSSELEEVVEKNPPKSPQTTARLFTILPQKANKKPPTPVSETAKKLEEKLTGTRIKPFGGIDTVKRMNETTSNSVEDFDSSSESEKETKTKKQDPNLPQTVPRTGKNNAWNTKDASKTGGGKKAPVKSMYEWDSDDDISEIK